MGELIVFILQVLLELIVQFLLWLTGDVVLSQRERKRPDPPGSDDWLVPLAGLLFGGTVGGISLAVFPTTFLGSELARCLNLVLAPLVTAGIAALLARRRVRRGTPSNVKLHFWFALAFSAGLVLVRFVWAVRT